MTTRPASAEVTVVLPTYNERGHILALLDHLIVELERAGLRFELIVVDDDSPDGTADAVSSRAEADLRVQVLVRGSARGLASAVRTGIERASGDVIVVMDADFNHDPADIPALHLLLESCDIAVGSRFVAGGGMADRWRHVASFLFNLLLRALLGTRVRDNLSGFFAARRTLLKRIDSKTVFYGYGDYFIRLLFLAWRTGLKVRERPVFYARRPTGVSKTRLIRTPVRYLIAVVRLRLGFDRPAFVSGQIGRAHV